jgi:predicted anti-sigma-YlaC factor YlaD
MTWHIPDATMRLYISEQVGAADAWSVEAHLMSCEACRRRFSRQTVADTDGDSRRERAWVAIAQKLPSQGRGQPGTRRREARVLAASGPGARWAWLASCGLLIILAAVMAISDAADVAPWLGVLAPVVSLLGVAMSYGSGLDHSYEVIASTPGGGLRLLLIRTATVLAVTTPTVLVAGLLVGYSSPWLWLAASLGLTLVTLAVGSVTGVERAAAFVAVGWALVSGAPLLTSSVVPSWLRAESLPMWLIVIVLAAVAVAIRRRSFNQLPLQSMKVEAPS